MIAIINTGEQDESGAHRYRLQINDTLIAEFTHHRIDGLEVCLQRASEASHIERKAHLEKVMQACTEAEKAYDND